MALGDGRHKLPVNTDVRKIIKKEEGDNVTIMLKERIEENSANPGSCLTSPPWQFIGAIVRPMSFS